MHAIKKEAYEKAYAEVIHPMNGPKEWRKTDNMPFEPPATRNPSGRPKKNEAQRIQGCPKIIQQNI